MRAKEYLQQAYLLDQKIDSYIRERDEMIEFITCLPSPQIKERVQISPRGEAYYERILEKLWDLEEMINDTVDLFVDLKRQIYGVLDAVEDPELQMILRFRYIHVYTWDRIADELGCSRRTAIYHHDVALKAVKMPKNPIKI